MGRLVMVNGFPLLPFGTIYAAKKVMRLAELKFLALLLEEINFAKRNAFGSIELIVVEQQTGEGFQAIYLSWHVPELFEHFQCFFGLLYPFPEEP